jgi:hypothetical protein
MGHGLESRQRDEGSGEASATSGARSPGKVTRTEKLRRSNAMAAIDRPSIDSIEDTRATIDDDEFNRLRHLGEGDAETDSIDPSRMDSLDDMEAAERHHDPDAPKATPKKAKRTGRRKAHATRNARSAPAGANRRDRIATEHGEPESSEVPLYDSLGYIPPDADAEGDDDEVTRAAAQSGRAGATLLGFVRGYLAHVGFAPAGPNAVGIIVIPSAGWRAPIPEGMMSFVGHTARYVRVNGIIVDVQLVGGGTAQAVGFGPKLSFLGAAWSALSGSLKAGKEFAGVISDDSKMFGMIQARTLEHPVSHAEAVAAANGLPTPGPVARGGQPRPGLPPGTPKMYSTRPAKAQQPGEISNCGLWATRQNEAVLGGRIGAEGAPPVADIAQAATESGPRRVVPGTAQQGYIVKLLKGVESGEVNLAEVPNATGPATVGGMSPAMKALTILGRGLMIGAPALEFAMRQGAGDSVAESGGHATATAGGLLGAGRAYQGKSGAGLADLAINLASLGLNLGLGEDNPISETARTAADLTPSSTILSGAHAVVDTGFAAADGVPGLNRLHEGQMAGGHGGPVQGAAIAGSVLAGEDTNWMTSDEADRGDYGPLVSAGNYLSDMATGDVSLWGDMKSSFRYLFGD